MCGICGVMALGDRPIAVEPLKAMCDCMAHRGPDDAGYFIAQSGHQQKKAISFHLNFTDAAFQHISPLLPVIDSDHGLKELHNESWDIFLGHRRLSVIDLSPAGHQPMSDLSKDIWLVYNGELYNYRELRQELIGLGYEFKSRSDTEVIIYAYKEWGLDCVERFNGMFAWALWDNHKKVLHLARDKYGVKPVYYTKAGNCFIFASEIKSILQYPTVGKAVNLNGLAEYFTFQNTFGSETLFKDIHILPPATTMSVDFRNGVKLQRYWDYNFTDRDDGLSFEECREETLRLLRQAVQRQLVADVSVGSYLSGGLDSGSITAIAVREIPRMSTFTAGFEMSGVEGIEVGFDERADAEIISNLCKTEHYEQVIHAGDIAWALPKVVWHLEDLRLGMSYPNYYISRLASKFVKVCLSGGGGDEIYGGYPWRYYRMLDCQGRDDFLQQYYLFWQRLVPENDKQHFFREDIYREIRHINPFDLFRTVFIQNSRLRYKTPQDHIANSLYFEIKTFLHGLFVVGDKLSMANSLEERFPFMDNDLVDFGMKTPISYKLSNLEELIRVDENTARKTRRYYMEHNTGKNVLRRAMEDILPPAFLNRRKQGFSSPDESWYRGENINYVKESLLNPRAAYTDFIHPRYVERVIDEHCSKGINHRLLIWSLLCFEQWLATFFPPASPSNL